MYYLSYLIAGFFYGYVINEILMLSLGEKYYEWLRRFY